MARRKGATTNTNKNRPVSVALHSVQFTSAQDEVQPDSRKITRNMVSESDQVPVSSQEKAQYEFAFNNNDHKYLHKKFKKMACAVSHQSEDATQPNILQSTSQKNSNIKVPSSKFTDPQSDSIVSVSNYIKYPNVLIDRDLENNVQIKFKNNLDDVSDSFGLTLVSECNETNSVDNKISEKTDHAEIDTHNSKETVNGSGNGRYVCPYCKLSCAKPSVLQKHIRAHTNERPYPCTPCGFAFKTKSNLYKHCRSRAHALRLQGADIVPSPNEDDWSLGSESDVSLSTTSLSENSLKVDNLSANENSSPDVYQNDRISPTSIHSNSTSQTEFKPKTIYKPKFHKANLYQENDGVVKSNISSNTDFLNQHISKIISDNEAVVDTLDSPLHKKFSKISTIQKQIGDNCGKNATTEVKETQPLNLTKDISESELNMRKRCYSESFAQQDVQKAPQHPLNPEGSIIKDLLLKARAQVTGLLPVTSEDYDGTETLYVCPLCQISYRSADNLEIHRLYYCKGNLANKSGTVSPTSRDLAKLCKTENIYFRSNSVHVTLPETYNPNTLAKLATSTLKTPSSKSNKPDDLVLKNDSNDITTPLPSPGPLLGNTRLVDTKYSLDSIRSSAFKLLENNRSRVNTNVYDESCTITTDSVYKSEDNLHRNELYSPPTKLRCLDNPTTLRSLEELSLSPMRQNSSSLQMFGGEVKILDNSGATTTLRIEPTRSQLSPALVPQSVTSPKLQIQPETSSIVVRSGLHSGGTIVHNLPTPKEVMPSPLAQTPRMKVSIAPNISTPNLAVAGIPAPNMTHFQFPPIGSITAYNPLTLPPLSPLPSPNGASTIFHGGKLIPYVPGMPGPNTPTSYLSQSQKINFKYMPNLELKSIDVLLKEDKINKQNALAQTVVAEKAATKMLVTKLDNHLRVSNTISLRNPERNTQHNFNNEKLVLSSPSYQKNQNVPSIEHKFLNIPNIIINSSENVKLKNGIIHQSAKQTQIKMDESLKGNSEIVYTTEQKNDSRQDSKIISSSVYESEKSLPKTQQKEIRHFNFENLISKSEIVNKSVTDRNVVTSIDQSSTSLKPERSETSYFKKNASSTAVGVIDQKNKFLRPSSLPLKPGTFTPKKHHGITPNANTLPLLSPETPRPAKAYGQLHLNGHAYTYLGLKCSTKVYFCTLNRPQPTYVPNQHSLSMYSNWQICSEATPHPLGLTPCKAMSLYDSRHRPQTVSLAAMKQEQVITHSSQWKSKLQNSEAPAQGELSETEQKSDSTVLKNKDLTGGFESNEDYIYVRGRGRGRYVCSECGIRCKKPSMLKKHIRTHTDVRPYTCKHCAFSFKTKGNLTKHMKSKSHYQKCRDLGISPIEELEANDATQGSGETDEGSDSDGDDGNEGETESSDTDSWKSRLPEHEAAQGLLSLWDGGSITSITPGILTTARPSTYPYEPQQLEDNALHKTLPAGAPNVEAVDVFKEGNSSTDHDEPMDLSKGDTRIQLFQEIVPSSVKEHSVIASLALTAVKFPQNSSQWTSGEPMLHAYLTEKALRDSKIKQSQYTFNKLRKLEEKRESINVILDKSNVSDCSADEGSLCNNNEGMNDLEPQFIIADLKHSTTPQIQENELLQLNIPSQETSISHLIDIPQSLSLNVNLLPATSQVLLSTQILQAQVESRGNENAKFVASEYLKMATSKSAEADDKQYQVHCDGAVERNDDSGNAWSTREVLEKNEIEKSKIPDHLGVARKVVVGTSGVSFKVAASTNEFTSSSNFATGRVTEDGRSVCVACNKSFSKPSQLRLHINIHYMERPFRCSACAVSFRTRGHLQKHERSGSHHNKVSMTSTFGAATSSNPRPFKCPDCKIAFRIHGHLAKHLRSKMHVMRLECLGKLPFGTFAEIERAGVSLTDIDTTDCDNSLASLQILAQKLHEKDPTKLESWDPATMVPPLLPAGRESSDEEDNFNLENNRYEMSDNRSAYKRTDNSDKFQSNFVKTQYSATDT